MFVPRAVAAHAQLVATAPAANATLAASPGEIALTFDEPVTIESAHALVVLRADGTSVPCAGGGPHPDPADKARIVCRPAVALARAAYTAFWLVTSDDTHVVHGSFSFGVGVSVREALGAGDYRYDPSGLLANVVRWLSVLGAALLVGTLAFEASVLRADAFPDEVGPALASLSRSRAALGRAGVCIAAFGSVLALDVQAAAATGSDALHAIPALPSVIAGSTWGLAWLARMCALAGISVLTWRGKPSVVSLGLCALLLLSFGQSGHAVTSKATLAADWIHFSCASIWFGGLATFAIGLKRAQTAIAESARPAFTAAVIRRFSVLAVPAVAALVASGVYASNAHYVTLATLTASTYGRVILAKVVLLVPLLALGTYHNRTARVSSSRTFAVTLVCEALILISILGLSGVLTGLAPPNAHDIEHG